MIPWSPHGTWNAVTLACVAGGVWGVRSLLRREPWRSAVRQLRERPAVMTCFWILVVYGVLGLADSITWRDPLLDEKGNPRLDREGKTVLEVKGHTLLDRGWKRLWRVQQFGDEREDTCSYSAPLARNQFSKDLVTDDQGRSQWVGRRLKYPGRHLLGTDKVGNDVLYQALKGIRTGLLIGGLTVLIAIPFALLMGVLAGYFGGLVDDAVQYLYTTLASIPSLLLIAAFLMIFKDREIWHLCLIMGVTSWTGLCRLVRAETLKLRETEYVQAATALGVPRWRILARHVVPNLLHLVTISAVLQFSGLVLSEAVLAYIGVGVGPDVGSWGRMINGALLELTRDPKVWWNLAAAFVFMFGLVLPANLFGDALRDALDPRLRGR